MSTLSIAPYFPWSRVVVCRQSVGKEADLAVLDLRPDERFAPLCSRCGRAVSRTCSHQVRAVRDLSMTSARVMLRLAYRKVYCPACDAVVVEQMEPVVPWQRITRRLARSVHELCKLMSVADVARTWGSTGRPSRTSTRASWRSSTARPTTGGCASLPSTRSPCARATST